MFGCLYAFKSNKTCTIPRKTFSLKPLIINEQRISTIKNKAIQMIITAV